MGSNKNLAVFSAELCDLRRGDLVGLEGRQVVSDFVDASRQSFEHTDHRFDALGPQSEFFDEPYGFSSASAKVDPSFGPLLGWQGAAQGVSVVSTVAFEQNVQCFQIAR